MGNMYQRADTIAGGIAPKSNDRSEGGTLRVARRGVRRFGRISRRRLSVCLLLIGATFFMYMTFIGLKVHFHGKYLCLWFLICNLYVLFSLILARIQELTLYQVELISDNLLWFSHGFSPVSFNLVALWLMLARVNWAVATELANRFLFFIFWAGGFVSPCDGERACKRFWDLQSSASYKM